MKKISLFVLALTGFALFAYGAGPGKSPEKFGDINPENLKMTVYAPDSSAAAVYIFDWGSAYIDISNLQVILDAHVRIKILNSDGFSYGNVRIPHSMDTRIMKFKGATYNLQDGKLVKSEVDKSMIFDEKVTSGNWKMNISFPDVHEGSIIEYSYRRTSKDLISLVPWSFQTKIPVMHSEFNVTIPQYFSYKTVFNGYEVLDVSTRKAVTGKQGEAMTRYHWVMKDVPALKEEPFMPDIGNFYSRVEFELESIEIPGQISKNFMTSWNKFEQELIDEEHFYKQINRYNFLKDSVSRLVEGKEGMARVGAVRDFVIRHVKWNEKERLLGSAAPKTIYKEGKGNSADINLMLVALLRKAGVDAYPVVLGTRDHGIIRDYSRPFVSKYNYTIACARVGDKEILLDATEPQLPASLLPMRCINGQGRLIKPTGSKWVSLSVPNGSNHFVMGQMEIDEEGNLTGTMNISSRGYSAHERRKSIDSKGLGQYIQDFRKGKGDWEITGFDVVNAKNTEKPLIEKMQCTIEGKVEDMGEVMILNPLLGSRWDENPFKSETRVFPVDFVTGQEDRYVISFKLPEGYVVDETPENVRVSTPDKGISYTYMVTVSQGNRVQILSMLKIKKPIFNQNEYQDLKKFFEFVREKQSEQIVLKRAI